MINFFRRIRFDLMENNKTGSPAETSAKAGKYLKYAIGEIVLVVIGILIALQINNWNEQRKVNKQELLLLKQLQSDINSNLDEVVELNMRLSINKQGIDSLVERLNKKHYDLLVPVYLAQSLRKSDFNNSSSGYNLMQNGKAALISDEAVLKSILNIYENDLPNILDRQSDMKTSIDFIQSHFVNKLFIKAPNKLNIQFKELDVIATDLFQPIDYNALAENIEFKNTLLQLGKLVESRLIYLSNTENKLNKTVSLLNSELELE